jgi:hypothetical protein
MANFTLETNRNTAIINIPRLTFQLPQSTTSATPSTINPVYFCQIGCQLEFQFTNITGAQLKNNGTYFTIIPTGNSNNYINWNGSGVSGQDMTRFDLQEINFSTPARDVVGSITYNRSIQFFFTFVNSNYPNIMIVITVIGQANNVGTAQSDGFVLLNSLSNQIPLRNEIKTVSNLSNVNLGFLLPPNKSFFSTLISNNTIQYISMTRIIDIPNIFLDNLISRVVGSTEGYQTKVNQYTQNIPTNPLGTIIFYTENVKPINSDQAYVCNSNCDRVVGDATMLQPSFGTSNTVRSASSGGTPTVPGGAIGAAARALAQEECEEEYFYPGIRTNVRVLSASSSSNLANSSDSPEVINKEIKSSFVDGLLIAFFLIIIIVGSIVIIFFLCKATNIYGLRSLFSREFWNLQNLVWIIIGLVGLFIIITFTALSLDMMIKQMNIKSLDESEKTDKDMKIENQQPWVFLLIGLSIYIICLCILIYKSWKNMPYSNSFSYNSGNNPFGSATLMHPQFSLDPLKFPGISTFNSKIGNILSDYQKSPGDYFKPGSQGIQDIKTASSQYHTLSQFAKNLLQKQNPSIANFLNPSSEFMKNIHSSKLPPSQSLNNLIDSLKYYNSISQTKPTISPDLIRLIKELQVLKPKNGNIKNLIPKLNIGYPIPLELYKVVANN